ncbi:MAG: hypothetical protein IT545_03615 [Rhodobacteraceae bacterium]|nr:hypothetical protein [Paracoccaceae bacterium]
MKGRRPRAGAGGRGRGLALAASSALALALAATPAPTAAAAATDDLGPAARAALAAAGWTAAEAAAGGLVLARAGLEIRALRARGRPGAAGGVGLRLEHVEAGAAAGAPARGRLTARRLYLGDVAALDLARAADPARPCGGAPPQPVSASFWDLDLEADSDALPAALAGPERLTAARLTVTLQAEPWRGGCRYDLLADLEEVRLAAVGGSEARIGRLVLRLSGAPGALAPVTVALTADELDLRLPGGAPLARAGRLTLAFAGDGAATGALAATDPWGALGRARLRGEAAAAGLATAAAPWLDAAPPGPAAGADAIHPVAGDLRLALELAGGRLAVAVAADLGGLARVDAALEATLGGPGAAAPAGLALPPALAGAALRAARLAWADRGLDGLVTARSGRGLAAHLAAAETAALARAPAAARPLLARLTAPAVAFLAGGVAGPVEARLAPARPVTLPALLRTLLLAPGGLARRFGLAAAP